MSTILDQFFLFLTYLGNYATIWLGIGLILAFQQKKKAKNIIILISSVIAFSFIATTILKLLFRIPRPSYLILDTKYCPIDYSFPSGHTATSVAAAVVLARLDPKRSWLYFSLAALISYSRIYLNCHHPEDIVGGVIIGMAVSMVVLKITKTKRSSLAKQRKTH